MAIEKFLAMEDGEPGYTKLGTVTHVPFAAGGNGVQITGGSTQPWRQANQVNVPFDNAGSVRVEFTSTTYWGVSTFGTNNIGQSSVEFIAEGIRTQRRSNVDSIAYGIEISTQPIDLISHRWGVRFVQSNTTGTIEVWCDGVLVVNRTTKTTSGESGTGNGASLDINSIRLTASGAGNTANFDSVVISDALQGDCHVDYLVPDGNGDTSQWVGSDGNSVDNWALIDEIPASATDYVEADEVDLRDLYTVANLPASGTILGVQAVVHPWKLGPGAEIPTSTILKTGVGEHVDLIAGMSTAMQGLETPIRTTRPGGGAWTVSDVNAMQIGVTTEEP